MFKFIAIAPLALAGLIGCSHSNQNTTTATPDQTASSNPKAQHACVGLVIFFETGESALSATASSQLEKLADCIDAKDAKEVIITGRTDPSGDPAENDMLAQRRAESVLAELKKMGISGTNVIIKLEGESGATNQRILWPFERRAEVQVGKPG